MADELDYGSARITIELDVSQAESDARDVGGRIERSLARATRDVGTQLQRTIQRGLDAVDPTVEIEADMRRLRRDLVRLQLPAIDITADVDIRELEQDLLRLQAPTVSVPVQPEERGFVQRLLDRLRGTRPTPVEVEVTADTTRAEAQVDAIDADLVQVEVTADTTRVESQVRSIDAPRVEVEVTADTSRARSELAGLAGESVQIPIEVGAGGAAAAAGAAAGSSVMTGLTGALAAAGPWGAIAAAAAGAALLIGQALMSGITGVIEKQQIEGLLRAQLGLGGQAAADAGRVAGQLYARGISESVEEGAQAVQAAIRAGLAAPDDLPGLERISTQVADLGRLMEEDVGQVARSVGQMVRTGLVDNAQEGFDLLTRGVQSGANAAEDLLDTFSEYSTQFRQLGLSGQEAMGLIQQGLRGGARDADVVADALKEFSIEAAAGGDRVLEAFDALGLDADRLSGAFAKGGPAARGALDEVLDALRDVEDPLERNRIELGLFGTKAEDLAAATKSLDLDTAATELDNLGGAAKRAGDDLRDNLGTRLETVAREAKQAFTGLFTGDFSQFADLGRAINDALPAVKEAALGIGDALASAVVEYGPKVFGSLFDLASRIGENVDIWGPLLLKTILFFASLPVIIGGLLLTALGGVLAGLGSKLLPYLQTAWDAVAAFFTETIPGWASSLGGALVEGLGSAFESARTAVADGISAAGDFFAELPGRVGEALSGFGEHLAGLFSAAWAFATEALTSGFTGVVGWFAQLPEMIWAGLQSLGQILYDAFTSAVAYAAIGLLSAIAGLIWLFTEFPAKAGAALLVLGQALWDAITAAWAWATSAVSSGVDDAVVFFQTLPGRAGAALVSLGQTLWSGITAAWAWARGAVSSGVDSAVSVVRQLPGRAGAALSSLGAAIVGRVSAAWTAGRSAVSAGIDTVLTLFRSLPGRVVSALSALGSRIGGAFRSAAGAARSAVSSLIGGVVNLFRSLPGRIVSAIGNVGSAIMGKIKAGIPSSVRKLLPFANGGIVTSATPALVGEAGPEVIIPLTRPQRARQLVEKSGLLDIIGAAAPGKGATQAPGTMVNHTWNITEVGDGRATAHRVTSRLALAGGLL